MNLNKNIFKVTFICLLAISFFVGYFLRENAVGGGPEFYTLTWPIIQSFKKDFLFTIYNYGSFSSAPYPLFHIINAYLNPFSNIDTHFQLSITVISFIIFILLGLILKRHFVKISYVDIWLTSSVILLLPFFRTSAFWGQTENFGWLFFILALHFFSEIKKSVHKTPNKRDIFNIVFFCLASSCALYTRQALLFLPISYLLYLFFYKANKKIILTSIVSFAILSIPGFLLILVWGGLFDTTTGLNEFFGSVAHPKHILKNIPILLSFFGFYFFPILIIEILNIGLNDFIKKYFKSFFFALIIFIILYQISVLDYLSNYPLSGGAVLKLNYLIKQNNYLLFLVFSSVGFSVLIQLIKEDIKNNIIILLPMIIMHAFANLLYQEYVEPLILIIFFLALNTNLHKTFFQKISLSNLIFLSYFAIYLLGSIYFKHFAFDTFEKWKIFLNIQ